MSSERYPANSGCLKAGEAWDAVSAGGQVITA